MTNAEIATALSIITGTVKTHLANVQAGRPPARSSPGPSHSGTVSPAARAPSPTSMVGARRTSGPHAGAGRVRRGRARPRSTQLSRLGWW
ncbi:MULTISPECIES: hypothetical protein [Streptomyces]|uniref:hypothetical protein n=1 Tax=Streptomyces TaxID=1883 RepID=UPI001E28FCDE|nr:hypothetical protein [Streptomyces ruber]